jgi:hypothetical protein
MKSPIVVYGEAVAIEVEYIKRSPNRTFSDEQRSVFFDVYNIESSIRTPQAKGTIAIGEFVSNISRAGATITDADVFFYCADKELRVFRIPDLFPNPQTVPGLSGLTHQDLLAGQIADAPVVSRMKSHQTSPM